MLKYARSDTHFILYIYDNIRSQTASQSQSGLQTSASSLLGQTLARSAETSLRVNTKEPYYAVGGSGQSGWDKLARKWNKVALTAGGLGVGVGAMQREVYRGRAWLEKQSSKGRGWKYEVSYFPLPPFWMTDRFMHLKICVAEPLHYSTSQKNRHRNGFFTWDVPDFGTCCCKKEGEGTFKCD
jgi:hypothetical protein